MSTVSTGNRNQPSISHNVPAPAHLPSSRDTVRTPQELSRSRVSNYRNNQIMDIDDTAETPINQLERTLTERERTLGADHHTTRFYQAKLDRLR